MACNYGCACCPYLVKSTAVSLDTDTNVLEITIPSASYDNHNKICLVITQAIPDGINSDTTVSILVGAGTTTAYPVYTRLLNYLYADAIKARKIYPLYAATDSQSFVIEDLRRLITTEHTFGTLPE